MYTRNPAKDALRFVKAFASNQLARIAPKTYVNLTNQTGRSSSDDSSEASLQVARYFIQCFRDYGEQLDLNEQEFSDYLKGKSVLEYGPGDILGIALLLYAHGAERVNCVDRFPLSRLSEKNISIYQHLLDSLDSDKRARADNAFNIKGDPASGFKAEAVNYKITENGLSNANRQYDLVISRAVLEHVNDLEKTMQDIKQSMKAGGISIHQVDLKSHGLDRYAELDFLTWPTLLYKAMYSHKGFPNRWRIDKYKQLAECSKLHIKKLTPTSKLEPEQISAIYPSLAKEFRHISPSDLCWKGFWIVLEHD